MKRYQNIIEELDIPLHEGIIPDDEAEIGNEMDRLAQDYENLAGYPLSLGSKRRDAARKFLRALKAFRAAGGKPSDWVKRLEAGAGREFKDSFGL